MTSHTLVFAKRGNLNLTIRVRSFAVQDKFDPRAVGDPGADSGPSPAGLPERSS